MMTRADRCFLLRLALRFLGRLALATLLVVGCFVLLMLASVGFMWVMEP